MRTLSCLTVCWIFTMLAGTGQEIAEALSTSGIRLKPIAPGTFLMGNQGGEVDYPSISRPPGPKTEADYRSKGEGIPPLGDNPLEWDEHPVRSVTITRGFLMGETPVTNVQYEQFRPEHKALRGKEGFSSGDNDAVVNVSWQDAVDFCEWLSQKEGRFYRLPTEAEWEYACRAGTTTPYSTGRTLPEAYRHNQVMDRDHKVRPERVSLAVGATPSNPWGLKDMHGLVEEWCMDWYGPYRPGAAIDPSGPREGIAKVTRGGSHTTGLPFLRSANRSAALPDTRSFLTGFRVVAAAAPSSFESGPEDVPFGRKTWNNRFGLQHAMIRPSPYFWNLVPTLACPLTPMVLYLIPIITAPPSRCVRMAIF
jgi:formylglycine-generating enzyme required for sulfatase activity